MMSCRHTSTSITDVVTPYGVNNLVHIADSQDEFIRAAEIELGKTDPSQWLKKVDLFLSQNSWDKTWGQMAELIRQTRDTKKNIKMNTILSTLNKENIYV